MSTSTVERIWKEDEIRELVQKNDKVLCKALMKLYSYQTAGEKSLNSTHEYNGVGFNRFDAKFLTSVCKWYEEKGFLTEGQKTAVRSTLRKYTKQLTKIANKEI